MTYIQYYTCNVDTILLNISIDTLLISLHFTCNVDAILLNISIDTLLISSITHVM